MRPFPLPITIVWAMVAAILPWPAHAGRDHVPSHMHRWARVEIFDRTAGHPLPVYVHRDRLYVAGEPGHRYELRLSNRSNERLLAVASVDGVNVITGKTADEQQSGYVLDPRDGVDIEGWRKNLDEVATFYFTRLSNSYAARTGRPEHVGVIGVAVFREHRRCCRHHPFEERAEEAAPAPSAQSDSTQADSKGADEYLSRRERDKLGTGHGHREDSPAHYVDFQRASSTPEETIVIYYDSRKNLLARGVIQEPRRHYADQDRPNPFPGGMFVPDP